MEREDLITRRKLVASEFLRTYKAAHVQDKQLVPSPVEFCSLPSVNQIIFHQTEDNLDASSFETLASQLPTLFDQWRQNITKKLCEELTKPIRLRITFDTDSDDEYGWGSVRNSEPRTRPSPLGRLSLQPTIQRLVLAKTVLTCKNCYDPFFGKWDNGPFSIPNEDDERAYVNSMPLFYPQALAHKCCDYMSVLKPGNESLLFFMQDSERSGASFFPSYHGWNPTTLRVDVSMSATASNLIEIVGGLDSRTTTVEMMDSKNLRYICLSDECCRKSPKKTDFEEAHLNHNFRICPMFDWRSVIKHHRDRHTFTQEKHELKQLYSVVQYDSLSPTLQEAEKEHIKNHTDGWVCMHCDPMTPSTVSKYFDDVTRHVIENHGNIAPIEDKDYAQLFAWRDIHGPSFGVYIRMTMDGPTIEEPSHHAKTF